MTVITLLVETPKDADELKDRLSSFLEHEGRINSEDLFLIMVSPEVEYLKKILDINTRILNILKDGL